MTQRQYERAICIPSGLTHILLMTTNNRSKMLEVSQSILSGCTLADAASVLVEKHAVKQSASRVEKLAGIFIHATKVSEQPRQESHIIDVLIDGDGILEHGSWCLKCFKKSSSDV